MKTNRAVLTAIVVVIVAVAGWWMFHRGSAERIDLLTMYDNATKKGGQFSLVDATLEGDAKKAILAPPNGRIIFHVRVPDDGWLKVSLGLKPEAWTTPGDGVYFYAGVSDGRAFEKLFDQTVNPYANKAERKWIPVSVDLSSYGGQEVDVVLNTLASNPVGGGQPDDRGDLPLWGAPELVRR